MNLQSRISRLRRTRLNFMESLIGKHHRSSTLSRHRLWHYVFITPHILVCSSFLFSGRGVRRFCKGLCSKVDQRVMDLLCIQLMHIFEAYYHALLTSAYRMCSVLQGFNSTIFAYGQTGSGKTYSIIGGTNTYEERGHSKLACAIN